MRYQPYNLSGYLMKMFSKSLTALTTLGSILLLTACGGGGGSGSASLQQTTTASTITSSNAQSVGAQAYSATSSTAGTISASTALLTGVSVTTTTTPHSLLDIMMQQAYSAMAQKPAFGLVTGVTNTETNACTNGGTMSVTYNVANVNTASPGDTFSIVTNSCVESDVTLNGTMGFTIGSISSGTFANGSAWSGSLTFNFTNQSVAVNGESVLLNGDFSINYSQTDAQNASYTVSGNTLQATIVKNGVTMNQTLSDYSDTGSQSGTLYTYSPNYTLSGNLGSLGNTSYAIKTVTPFKQNGDNYPYEGEMTITATDNTSVTLTAIDNTSVRLDLDTNGDGTTDQTKTVLWTDLQSSAF